MKKMMAMVLSLLLVLSLTACGGKTEAPVETGKQVEAPVQTEAPVTATEPVPTEIPTEVPTEAPTEPPVETTVEVQAAFDNSWASNEFEAMIPQPPFEGWTGEQTSDNVYEMVTTQANADEILNDDGSWAYYDTWAAYIQTVIDCGFAMEGEVYQSRGSDAAGNQLELMCGDGGAWITITKAG